MIMSAFPVAHTDHHPAQLATPSSSLITRTSFLPSFFCKLSIRSQLSLSHQTDGRAAQLGLWELNYRKGGTPRILAMAKVSFEGSEGCGGVRQFA